MSLAFVPTHAAASIGLAGIESSVKSDTLQITCQLQSDLLELKGRILGAGVLLRFRFNRTCWN